MESCCVRHTQIPGTSHLFSDFLYNFDRVSDFYPAYPLDPQEIQSAARAVHFPQDRREAIAAALVPLNSDSPLIEKLRRPDTVAIVTGQQAGLYGGPCYTIYKALSAIRCANDLNAAGLSAVPVFWIATEDHDFDEIDHTWVFDSKLQPKKLTAQGNGRPQQPVGNIALTEIPQTQLREQLQHFPFGEEVLSLVEAAYQPGRSFGEAFRILIRSLLGDHRILFIDPLDPGVRKIAGPFMREAALKADLLSRQVMGRSKQLTDAGYHAQVHFEGKDASLFFQIKNGRRTSLKSQNPAQLADQPETLSPNALLRPVLQDYLLPTAAMIGGPAEIAYLAQSAVLYEELLGRQTVALPRSSFTLFDFRSAKLMDRYHLSLPEILNHRDAFRQKIAEKLVPASVHQEFELAEKQTQAALCRLEKTLQQFDPTLQAALEKSRSKISYQLEKTSRKIARETLRRKQQEQTEIDYLCNSVYPHQHLQERFYSILPFLAQHGPNLIDSIYENIHVSCLDHRVLPV